MLSSIVLKAEAIGLRRSFSSCPTGTPSRTVGSRLKRFAHFSSQQPLQDDTLDSRRPVSRASTSRRHALYDVDDVSIDDMAEKFTINNPWWNTGPSHFLNNNNFDRRTSSSLPLDTVAEDNNRVSWKTPWLPVTQVPTWMRDVMGPDPTASITELDSARTHLLFERALAKQDAPTLFRLLSLVTLSPWPEGEFAIRALPRTSIGAIFKCLDPLVVGAQLDYAHGLRIPGSLQNYSSMTMAFDKVGVRHVYKDLFKVLFAFANWLKASEVRLSTSEYIVLIRSAGATSDKEATKMVWNFMTDSGSKLKSMRLTEEFLGARYMTNPLYLQNDLARSRVRRGGNVQGQDFTNENGILHPSGSPILLHHYGRSPQDQFEVVGRTINNHGSLEKIWNHGLKRGIQPELKTKCAYIAAAARSGKVQVLYELMDRYLGIALSNYRFHRRTRIIFSNRDNGLGIQTELLAAMVSALAANGCVVLAERLLVKSCRQYGLQVPSSIWSGLLSHAYIYSSRHARTESGGRMSPRRVGAVNVISIWNAMVSKEHNVQPSLEDFDKYVNVLIQLGQFEKARAAMRLGIQHYTALTDSVQDALFECLYPAPPASSSHEFLSRKAQQHSAWYMIMRWCASWVHRYNSLQKGTHEKLILSMPEFIAEFRAFLPDPLVYDTPTGTVQLTMADTASKGGWKLKNIGPSADGNFSVKDSSRGNPGTFIEDDDWFIPAQDKSGPGQTAEEQLDTMWRSVRARKEMPWEKVGVYDHCVLRRPGRNGRGVDLRLRMQKVVECVVW